jgi:hypothetical protein
MTSTVLTFLIIVLLLAAAWSWRDPDAPRHVSLGFLVLASCIISVAIGERIPAMRTVLLLLNVALTAALLLLWWRWRRGNAA